MFIIDSSFDSHRNRHQTHGWFLCVVHQNPWTMQCSIAGRCQKVVFQSHWVRQDPPPGRSRTPGLAVNLSNSDASDQPVCVRSVQTPQEKSVYRYGLFVRLSASLHVGREVCLPAILHHCRVIPHRPGDYYSKHSY